MGKKQTKKQTKEERIKYLETEIAHGRYWDGWSLQGMINELKELIKPQKRKKDDKR
tara:strand:+ start:2272 stop:2439 length:168 start_codon:yes stop_codon:yes gene_type:complete